MKTKFKNNYSERRKKNEFYREIEGESKTDQDQLAQASISIMAEKFGIDAIINKARQMEPDEYTKSQLYGRDLTKYLTNKDEVLNLKRDLNLVFETLPAMMRKQLFNDRVEEFVEAYSSSNIEKLEALKKYGLVHEQQLDNLKEYFNKEKLMQEKAFEEKVQQELKKQISQIQSKGEIINETNDGQSQI